MINFSLVPGTGHGVGAALNVHEGPQSISYRYGNLTALQKGMIVSNEPGYYEDNSFGIRIEVGFPTLCSCQSPKFLGLNWAIVQIVHWIAISHYFFLNLAESSPGQGG